MSLYVPRPAEAERDAILSELLTGLNVNKNEAEYEDIPVLSTSSWKRKREEEE